MKAHRLAGSVFLSCALSITPSSAQIGRHYAERIELLDPDIGEGSWSQPEVMDINGDGRQDFLHSEWDPNFVSRLAIWTGNELGSMDESTDFLIQGGVPTIGRGYRQILPGDFNGDGRLDLFLEATGTEPDCGDGTVHCWEGGQNSLLLSDGEGKLNNVTATHLPEFSDFSHGCSLLDFDGDGDLDIYVNNLGGSPLYNPGVSYMLENDGEGFFTFAADVGGQRNGIFPEGNYYFNWWSSTFDADGDGDADLAGVGPDVDRGLPSILLVNTGAGSFELQPEAPWQLPSWSSYPGYVVDHLLTHDVNGDGLEDQLHLHGGDVQQWIQILISNGDGTFRDESEERYPGLADLIDAGFNDVSMSDFQLHDLDGDGHKDLFAHVNGFMPGDHLDVRVNDGEGFFRPLDPDWAVPGGFWVVLDVDGDGGSDFLEPGVLVGSGYRLSKMILPYGAALDGTPAGERMIGGAHDNVYRGLEGDDFLDGGLGDDCLDGGPGSDSLLGGKGDDRYKLHVGELDGDDTVQEKEGDYDALEFVGFGTPGVSAAQGADGDLILGLVGGGSLTVHRHFGPGRYRVERLITGDTVYSLSNDPAFGAGSLEDLLGPPCSPVDLTISSPPTISGLFEACDFVSAAGVQVVSPGATLRAGRGVLLGDGFSVASGADLTVENALPTQ